MALFSCAKHILTKRPSLLSSVRHGGYIILVPEIGEDLPDKNPLLQHDHLPEFNEVTIEKCMAAVAKQTLEFEAGVKSIEMSWSEKDLNDVDIHKEVLAPLEELGTPLDMTWGLSKTLYLGNSTRMPTKSYLSIHDRAKRARAAKFNSGPIFRAVKLALDKRDKSCTEEKTRVLKKFALEGRLNGLELDSSLRSQLHLYLKEVSDKRAAFKQKIDIATKRFRHNIEDGEVVRDFPLQLLQVLAGDIENPLKGPWKITLEPHIYLPVMEHCPDRDIRWNIWQSVVGRGSGYGDRDLSTSWNLEEIREIRRDMAKILGYETYAAMSMETKMAGSVETVEGVLRELLERSKPAQDKELASLHKFALERGFKGSRIELWDLPYWRRKQRLTLYEYDEDRFKVYFPLKKVLDGLFRLCEKLFGVIIKRRNNVSVWHKDVQFYDVFEPHSSAPVGGFYLDPYARSQEKIRIQQNNGWMVGIQNHSKITDTKPLAALIFNFDCPTKKTQTMLSFREVKTLFHKFGLTLQHLLTRTNYSEVAGTSNIEWDVVDVSGHVLTHWLLNQSTIESITSHCDSGITLPPHMYQNLVTAHNHLAGTDLSRDLYLSLLDLELHHTKEFWLDIVKRLWPQFRSFSLEKIDSHPCSFTEIFTEEWGAAYYSHVWSRMIAADVYSAFHEVQNDETKVIEIGKRYRDTFLALGGSSHPSKTFRKFRGRDPSTKALLKSLGLKKSNSEDM